MVNEEKLKLMTSLAMFEKSEGRRLSLVRRYFKGDYISRSMLQAFLGYTFCWIVGLALSVACRIEEILAIVSLEEARDLLTGYAAWYAAGLAVYLLIAFIVSRRRYGYAARAMKVYAAKLKRLNKRYEIQSRARERSKEGRRP